MSKTAFDLYDELYFEVIHSSFRIAAHIESALNLPAAVALVRRGSSVIGEVDELSQYPTPLPPVFLPLRKAIVTGGEPVAERSITLSSNLLIASSGKGEQINVAGRRRNVARPDAFSGLRISGENVQWGYEPFLSAPLGYELVVSQRAAGDAQLLIEAEVPVERTAPSVLKEIQFSVRFRKEQQNEEFEYAARIIWKDQQGSDIGRDENKGRIDSSSSPGFYLLPVESEARDGAVKLQAQLFIRIPNGTASRVRLCDPFLEIVRQINRDELKALEGVPEH